MVYLGECSMFTWEEGIFFCIWMECPEDINVSFKTCVSLLIFCFDDLSIGVLLLLLLSTSVVSNSMWPQRWQPTRLPHPWDSPGQNTGVGCHFLLQCMKVKSESEVVQFWPNLSNTMDCSPPGSSVHGIFQARVLEWDAIAVSSPLVWVGY